MALVIYAMYLVVVMPVAAMISCAIYLTRIPAVYLTALTRVMILRPAWLPDPPRWRQPPDDSDPAVLQYFYGPALADVIQAGQAAFHDGWRRWRKGIKSAFKSLSKRESRLAGLLNLASAAGMTAGALLGALAVACLMLVHCLIVALGTAAGGTDASGATTTSARAGSASCAAGAIAARQCGQCCSPARRGHSRSARTATSPLSHQAAIRKFSFRSSEPPGRPRRNCFTT